MRDQTLSDLILIWYDKHARTLPWRVSPADHVSGVRPDPYRIWLSEIMLQQTTVATVKSYFHEFTTRWPDVHSLAAAQDGDVMAAWAGLGYYARARNLLKCARVLSIDFAGQFPETSADLQKLPGIGPYTAAAISSIAFDFPAAVVDGNVERVMARIFKVTDPLQGVKKRLTELAQTLTPDARPGDYAQAVMDLGATVCTPKSPSCQVCPWCAKCGAFAEGIQAELPTKTPKPAKPVRYGFAYIAIRKDGALLLERRPDKGLLGGMLGWPGSDWSADPDPTPPFNADWQKLDGEVRHTFTHFHLRLVVFVANVPLDAMISAGTFVDTKGFRRSDLPTVMRKAFDLTVTGPGNN